jgi:hypothetical protein
MASHDWVPGDSGGSKYFQGITHKGGAHCVPEGRIPFHDVCLLGGLALSLAVRCYATALLRSLKLHAVHAGTACCSCMIRGSSVDQWAVMGKLQRQEDPRGKCRFIAVVLPCNTTYCVRSMNMAPWSCSYGGT